MERVKGIEPSSQPWEGHILPLNHTRLRQCVVSEQTAPTAFIKRRLRWQLVCNRQQNLGGKSGQIMRKFEARFELGTYPVNRRVVVSFA